MYVYIIEGGEECSFFLKGFLSMVQKGRIHN